MKLEVTFWDVGQGDCSVVRLPDGRLIIIDVGPADSPLLDWLMQRPGERIYAVVLTHNDEDHAGCFASLMEQCGARVEHQFILLDRSDRDVVTQRIVAAAARHEERGVGMHRLEASPTKIQPIYACEGGDSPPVLVYAVHPGFKDAAMNQIAPHPRPNGVSAVVCLKVGQKVEAIWPGDVGMMKLAKVCAGAAPAVVVGPHHGAPVDRQAANYGASFEAVRPAVVVVSVGTKNRYDHPVKSFVRRHRSLGRRVCCTQLQHCDRVRIEQRQHVVQSHLSLGVLPPRKPSAVSCRGPLVMRWNSADRGFEWDRFHAVHLHAVHGLNNAQCLPLL
jgi:Metallo-beta-lactamase superfamily